MMTKKLPWKEFLADTWHWVTAMALFFGAVYCLDHLPEQPRKYSGAAVLLIFLLVRLEIARAIKEARDLHAKEGDSNQDATSQ